MLWVSVKVPWADELIPVDVGIEGVVPDPVELEVVLAGEEQVHGAGDPLDLAGLHGGRHADGDE